MKKVIAILLALALLCAGCGTNTPAETTAPAETVPATTAAPETTAPPETTEETIPVPELTSATAKAEAAAVLALLNRGDEVEIVGEYDETHYAIRMEVGYGLVEKAFVRLADQPAFESKTGYARYGAGFHDNFHLTGEPLQTLKTNTKLTLLEDLGHCWLVELEGVQGYVSAENVSMNPIKGGTGNASADGGDISLMVPGIMPLFNLVPQEGDVTGTATVLADKTPVVLGWFERGEEMPVVAEEGFAEPMEGCLTLYLNGLYAYVDQSLARSGEEAAYEEWDGFARYKATLHSDLWCLTETTQTLKTNTTVHVIEDLGHCYLVEVEGEQGYIAKDMVSEKRIVTGGTGNSSSEWSPPAM